MMNPLSAIAVYGRMIKFSHSIFALPFALSGAALAAAQVGIRLDQLGWIIAAMVGARSAAMGFNRLVDRGIDAENPRTRNRELPRGDVSPPAVAVFVLLSGGVLIWAARELNPLCFYLSPLVLAVLLLYSYTKRFTWASHLVLGLCLGGAPVGAWIAVTGGFGLAPLLLGLAVLTWVAGFDVIYACLDRDFDLRSGLHSIPARFGIARALRIARFLHVLATLFLVAVGLVAQLHALYFFGIAVIAGLLVYEHRLVSPRDMSRVGMAFLTMNSTVSSVYLAFTLADLVILGDPWTLLQLD